MCSLVNLGVHDKSIVLYIYMLFGGFNPSENFESNWIISPGIGVKIKNI